MNANALTLPTALLALWLSGCVQEGHSADCEFDDRGELEDEGCLTPIGGSCLTESDFKASRPARRDDDDGDDVTVEEDWLAYQCARPLCFDCMTEDEYEEACPDLRWSSYIDLRPECE